MPKKKPFPVTNISGGIHLPASFDQVLIKSFMEFFLTLVIRH